LILRAAAVLLLAPALPALGLLVLGGCDRAPASTSAATSAGASLERAALAAGIVADPARLDPVGAYAADTDRICLTANGDSYRIGASIDYGERQGCIARGTARGRETLHIDFGEDCRFEARFDGERISFPATVPSACERRCTGRATLAALTAERLSGAAAEARAMRSADGEPLCD
jgi:hypothetical protein